MPVAGDTTENDPGLGVDRYRGFTEAASELGCDADRISTGNKKAWAGGKEGTSTTAQITTGCAILMLTTDTLLSFCIINRITVSIHWLSTECQTLC